METTTTTKTSSVHIFRSKLPDIYTPNHLPIHSYIFENLDLENRREKPCIIDGPTGRVYTYGEIELAARRYAAGLARIGISKGDVVMILLPNSPDFAIAFLGTSYRGGTVTTANPFFTAAEIAKQALAAKARVIVTRSVHVEKLRELISADSSLKVVVTDRDHEIIESWCLPMSELLMPTDVVPEVDISPDDLVALPYSSGTTGLPKGVMLSHRSLVTSVGQHVDGENPNLYFSDEDVILCVLPMFHIYALTVVLLGGLRRGVTVVAMPKFDMAGAMELVQRYRVTVAPFVPPVIQAMVKCPAVTESYDLSSIRMIITGAAPLGKQLYDAMQALLPNAKLGQGYGMTEAGPLSMSLGLAKVPFEVKPGSCGTVVRNAEMKIIHPDHDHNTPAPTLSLPRNQPGEICVRGVQIMKGYLNDEEATKRTIDEEGWLHTGDVGYVDDNDELFIVDRLKELIKYKGFQVAPAELEALLNAHPAIAESAAVPMKDEAAGEIPVAFVVRSNTGTGHEVTTEDDIKMYIAKQVVFYKKIHKVFFIESIPKAPSGKILRKNLRAMLEVIAI